MGGVGVCLGELVLAACGWKWEQGQLQEREREGGDRVCKHRGRRKPAWSRIGDRPQGRLEPRAVGQRAICRAHLVVSPACIWGSGHPTLLCLCGTWQEALCLDSWVQGRMESLAQQLCNLGQGTSMSLNFLWNGDPDSNLLLMICKPSIYLKGAQKTFAKLSRWGLKEDLMF